MVPGGITDRSMRSKFCLIDSLVVLMVLVLPSSCAFDGVERMNVQVAKRFLTDAWALK